jgi:glycoprotein endo-alpha-1,2-mannosidase
VHLLCVPSVGPGYDARRATGDTRVKSRRNGITYDSMWSAAIAAKADGVTITSFNEWHEGTQIEPAARHARYLDYDGAWGLTGRAAETAYLERTARWSAIFRKAILARRTAATHH